MFEDLLGNYSLGSNGIDGELLFVSIFILFCFFWIISIIWVAKDIWKRTNNFAFIILSILLVTLLTPVFGLLLYLAIRPVNYKYDKIPRRESLAASNIECFNCNVINPLNHVFCANCGTNLMVDCKECKKKYSVNYKYCNDCGAPNLE